MSRPYKKLIVLLGIVVPLCGKISLGERFSFLKKGAAAHLFAPDKKIKREICQPDAIAEQNRLFGYDLAIEYQHGTDRPYCHTSGRAILYLHPWGLIGIPNKRSAEVLKHYNVLPGNIIVFNFADGGWRRPFPFVYSSFGQLADVLPALYTLAYAYDHFGVRTVDIFGYSRGGAVAINMIAVLCDKTGAYDEALATIGITKERREKLLEVIKRGSLVLNCPLVEVNTTFQRYSDILQTFLLRYTSYDKDGLQALQSAQKLEGLPLKTLLHFQYNDKRVFNMYDSQLYCIFKRANPDTTFLVLGDDGGHAHTQKALAGTIHTFYKKVGGAYDPSLVLNEDSDERTTLLQPSLCDADRVIHEFYNMCAYRSPRSPGSAKNNPSSRIAVSGLSDPCTAL